ncbi:probable G-protein coupled receptor 142 [Spea bombifrons]|uniref:probable G-protein coupled receptor 142 n=1 Tax=Spea bombifrons TaxID=233779 RepID=UPI00234A1D93|nr:probable G-protein coupled receptor 142 [Spea bombifrons]
MILPQNTTEFPQVEAEQQEKNPDPSPCVLGIIPIIYYSVLLCLGLPVNLLSAVVLSRLASKTKKSSYIYLLALTTSDILTQVFIVFVGFILQTAILHRKVPNAFIHLVSVLEFSSNHASIWITVLLTIDRYLALCYPLQYRSLSYPERTRRIIAIVFLSSFVTGIPFYWWSDVWRDPGSPGLMDRILKWVHCFLIYFIPCTIFLLTNTVIICKLRKKTESKRYHLHLGKTTAILMGITTVFAVLWAPRTIVIIIHMYVSSVNKDWRVHLAMDIGNMLALLNTAVNFFLYSFVSVRFRDTLKDVLWLPRPCCPKDKKKEQNESYSNSLKPLEIPMGTVI